MSFARADALAYLSGLLAQWLTDAGLLAADTAGNLKEPIDRAYLDVGAGWDDLATATIAASAVPGFLAVLDWRGHQRVLAAIAGRVDIEVTGDGRKSRSQAVRHLQGIVDDLAKRAAPHVTAGVDAPTLVTIQTYSLGPIAAYDNS